MQGESSYIEDAEDAWTCSKSGYACFRDFIMVLYPEKPPTHTGNWRWSEKKGGTSTECKRVKESAISNHELPTNAQTHKRPADLQSNEAAR